MVSLTDIPSVWARSLGLVEVELFPPSVNSASVAPGAHSALLDGRRGSFALSIVSGTHLSSEDVRSWAWSANFAHHLTIDGTQPKATYRGWDRQRTIELPYPRTEADRAELLAALEGMPLPRGEDVVLHLLRAYRHLVALFPDQHLALRVLNALVAAASETLARGDSLQALAGAGTVSEFARELSPAAREAAGIDQLDGSAGRVRLGIIPTQVLNGRPDMGLPFEPRLFIRHAASELYQEALRDITRRPQMDLPGLGHVSDQLFGGTRDVYFTPASLCRLLVQRALDAIGDLNSRKTLHILDPACGSGMFLQEAARELADRGYSGQVNLTGYDITGEACTVSRFVLWHTKTEHEVAGPEISIDIHTCDALETEWPKADIILMNPPFTAWPDLDPDQRGRVRDVLGELAHQRPDLAMAFVWRAIASLRDEGALGTVLPASLLETSSGARWREAIATESRIDMLGKLGSTAYFRGAIVEPAFLVARKAAPTKDASPANTLIVRCDPGAEDAAIRMARVAMTHESLHNRPQPVRGVDVYLGTPPQSATSWVPRSARDLRLEALLTQRNLPKVADLFEIKQGIRMGHKRAFLVSDELVRSLPKRERTYFRPALMNGSIFDGKISPDSWLFYPYGTHGLLFETEAELNNALPTFLKRHLAEFRTELRARQRVGDRWWQLAEPRSWQRTPLPKLVSTYFGNRGKFALDTEGTFLCVQGHAWLWKRTPEPNLEPEMDEIDLTGAELQRLFISSLGYAYLALFNSGVFDKVLDLVCPRVAGGQYNLSAQYAGQATIPDLASASRRVVGSLTRLGREIAAGGLTDVIHDVDQAARAAYGIPVIDEEE